MMLQTPNANVRIETAKPSLSAARSGADEKLITPAAAKRSIRWSGYFVSPAKRSLPLCTATPVCCRPIQENMPRTKRLLSRIWRTRRARAGRRAGSRPRRAGTCTSEIRLKPR